MISYQSVIEIIEHIINKIIRYFSINFDIGTLFKIRTSSLSVINKIHVYNKDISFEKRFYKKYKIDVLFDHVFIKSHRFQKNYLLSYLLI